MKINCQDKMSSLENVCEQGFIKLCSYTRSFLEDNSLSRVSKSSTFYFILCHYVMQVCAGAHHFWNYSKMKVWEMVDSFW